MGIITQRGQYIQVRQRTKNSQLPLFMYSRNWSREHVVKKTHKEVKQQANVLRRKINYIFSFKYFTEQCFICRPSDSTVSGDAGIETRTVATWVKFSVSTRVKIQYIAEVRVAIAFRNLYRLYCTQFCTVILRFLCQAFGQNGFQINIYWDYVKNHCMRKEHKIISILCASTS